MATITENKVISNQVFTAIQQGKSYESHTGTIIYANKYSGLQEVDMPDEFRTILDSSLGSIGTNPLQQLRAKLEGLPGGPWFLDSRNGTLYIHNRKFQEDVVHNYVYQAENEEVLQISFETQRTSRSLSHIGSGNIDPYSKNITGSSTSIDSDSPGPGSNKDNHYGSYDDIPVQQLVLDQHPEWGGKMPPIDTTKMHKENTQPWQTFRNREQQANIYASYQEWKKKKEATERSYKKYRGQTGEQQAQQQINKTPASKKSIWVRHIMGKSKLTAQDKMLMAEEMGKAWRYTHNKSDILKIAQKYLGYGTHNIVSPVWSEQWVDPTTYSGKGMFQGRAREMLYSTDSFGKITSWSNSSTTLVNNKLNLMKQDPNIKVMGGVTFVKRKTGNYRGDIKYYSRVKVFRYHYISTKVNAAQIVADDAIRILVKHGNDSSQSKKPGISISTGGGGNSWSGDIGGTISENRHGNRGRRATEKKLVVNMKVIGRPSLETSQIIHIDNVGSKWSGDYYIKSVTHDMSSDSGYTCQLELQRNGSQAEIESVSVHASTEKVVKDNDSSNRDRKFTHTDTDSKSSKIDRKVYTPTRTTSTSSKPRNTKQADKK